MVIDFDRTHEHNIYEALELLRFDMIHAWSRTSPSPADTRYRGTVYGYLKEEATELHCTLLARTLQAALASFPHTVVGHTGLLRDPGALIMDSLGPAGMLATAHLSDQMLLLSPRKAALITSSRHSDWEEALTEQANGHETERVFRLAWRRSTRGGRAWATPMTITPQQRAALTSDWQGVAGITRSTVYIQTKGNLDITPDQLGAHLAERLATWSGQPWSLQAMGTLPKPGQLSPVSGETGTWDGAFVLETRAPEQTEQLANYLNQHCIPSVNGPQRLRVEVRDDYSSTGRARPRQGGGRRRR
jgi:hypothetical protein